MGCWVLCTVSVTFLSQNESKPTYLFCSGVFVFLVGFLVVGVKSFTHLFVPTF